MAKFKKFSRYRRLKRYRQIINVLIRNGFGYVVQKTGVLNLFFKDKDVLKNELKAKEGLSAPQRARKVLEELGPTFIKIGQVLSTRPDIVPLEYIEEFKNLQNNAKPIEFNEIKEIIEDELGGELSSIFEYVNPEPLAAASIAQVHKAKLKDGTDVVIKVMRPNILETVENDLSILFDIARLIEDKFENAYVYQPVNAVEEISEAIKKELDFNKEARNTDKFRKCFKSNQLISVPQIYWEYTRKNIIVMDYMDGIKITDKIKLRENGIDIEKVAGNLADCFMNQIFKFGYFHADPHPGNIMVNSNSQLIFLDFGMVGNIDEILMNDLLKLIINIVDKNVNNVTSIVLKIGIPKKEVQIGPLRKDLREFIDDYYDKSLEEIEISTAVNEVFQIALKHGIAMPSQLILLVKTLVTIEGVVLQLYPDFKFMELLKTYAAKALKDKYSPANVMKELKNYFNNLFDNVVDIPEQVSTLLYKINSDKIKVDVVHSGFEDLLFNMNKMINRLVLAIIVASIVVGSALLAQVNSKEKIFGIPVIGFMGFVFGGIFGIWIIVGIIKSGNT